MTQATQQFPLVGIIGPSGTGKSTLLRMLMDQFPTFQEAVSYTTREPRKGEVTGKDYHFITREEFAAKLDDMVEHVEYNGNLYGMSKSEMDKRLETGPVFIIVEGHGAAQFKKVYGDRFKTVFLLPPSQRELRKRLVARKESPEVIERRIASIGEEVWYARHASTTLPPADLTTTYTRLTGWLTTVLPKA